MHGCVCYGVCDAVCDDVCYVVCDTLCDDVCSVVVNVVCDVVSCDESSGKKVE